MKQLKQLKSLYKACFDDSDEFIDYFFENYYNQDNVVFCSENGRIVSAVHLIYKSAKVRGGLFLFPFLTAVSTISECRGRGLATENMYKVLDVLLSKGVAFAALYPVSPAFYCKFGYSSVNFVSRRKVAYNPLKAEINVANAEKLYEIYSKTFSDCKSFLVRSREDFVRFLGDWQASGNTTRTYCFEDKSCYCTFNKESIEEAVGDTDLLGCDTDLVGLSYDYPTDLAETHNTMCRIVDVKSVLEGITYDKDGTLKFVFEDVFFPTNSGLYELAVKNGRGKLTKLESKISASNGYDLSEYKTVTVSRLNKWVFEGDDSFSDLLLPTNFICYDKY